MLTTNDVHRQFAEFFPDEAIKPLAYLLSKKLSEGHICLPLSELEEEVPETALIGNENNINRPFILDEENLYLQRYYKYETTILEKISAWMQEDQGKQLTGIEAMEGQEFASRLPLTNHFTIITGGPGTGKTTTVAKALQGLFLQDPNLRVALAAPTGKAAVRLAESLSNSSRLLDETLKQQFASLLPGTIHRLLGHRPDSPYFKYDTTNPLPFDVVVVDESSMIDAALFAKLLDAVPPSAKLILLGDKDQLASVEAGSLFGDICDALLALSNKYQNIAHLKKSYRFSGDKGIGRLSKAVITGNLPELSEILQSGDEEIQFDGTYSTEIFEQFISGYEDYILEPDTHKAIKKFNAMRVLTAIRSGEQGLTAVNKRIEKYLQQRRPIKPVNDFYLNRPVMVGRNHYDAGIFNGDIGIVRPDENGAARVWFEDSSGALKSVLPGFISESETAFAMTIHKSQGSEYDKVLTLLPDADLPILTAELLYTAVSRAKRKLIIQAKTEIVLSCAQRRVQRASGISQRLTNKL